MTGAVRGNRASSRTCEATESGGGAGDGRAGSWSRAGRPSLGSGRLSRTPGRLSRTPGRCRSAVPCTIIRAVGNPPPAEDFFPKRCRVPRIPCSPGGSTSYGGIYFSHFPIDMHGEMHRGPGRHPGQVRLGWRRCTPLSQGPSLPWNTFPPSIPIDSHAKAAF